MKIRRADSNDTEAIVKVSLDTWETSSGRNIPYEDKANLPYEAWINSYRKSIFKDDVFVYVAESEAGEIIGFAIAGPERFGNPYYKGELYAIYVLKDYQRKGLGSLLFQAVLDTFNQLGIYSVMVMVLTDNPYKRFYEASGGKKINIKPMAKSMNIKGLGKDLIAYGWDMTSKG